MYKDKGNQARLGRGTNREGLEEEDRVTNNKSRFERFTKNTPLFLPVVFDSKKEAD
jgi:hypothetical protein